MTVYDYMVINMATAEVEHVATNANYEVGDYFKTSPTMARPNGVEYAVVGKTVKYRL